MSNITAQYRLCMAEKHFLRSVFVGLLFLGVSLVFNHVASVYATEQAGNPVKDILLDNLPVVNVDFIVNEGTGIFGLFIIIILILKPKSIPFVLKSGALFVFIRSIFIIFTHLGPFPEHSYLDPNDLFRRMTLGGDYFFSGHTGLPFLFTLIFWDDLRARLVCLAATLIFATSVLFGHLHYSIDVFAAFFITYTIFDIAKHFFPIDWKLLQTSNKNEPLGANLDEEETL